MHRPNLADVEMMNVPVADNNSAGVIIEVCTASAAERVDSRNS